MRAISRGLSRFCYNHPNLGIPDLIKYIALGNVFVYIADMLTNGWVSMFIRFYPELILQGQVWRLVTFIFSPLSVGGGFWGPFFFAVTTYFYYWIGSSLERQWGSTRFTVFYGLGVLLNIVVGIVTYLLMPITSNLSGYYFETATMYYVNLSMFFSFATLYPDMQVVLTLGKDGSVYQYKDQVYRQGIFSVQAVDTTAAGDTFTGYFISSILEGMPVDEGLKLAAKASAIAVSREGATASIPVKAEVESVDW